MEAIAVPEGLEELAAAQSAIGWKELVTGWLSKQWAHHQQQHLGRFNRKKNGQTWTIRVAQTILEGWLDLWKSRNADRHGQDAQPNQGPGPQRASTQRVGIVVWIPGSSDAPA